VRDQDYLDQSVLRLDLDGRWRTREFANRLVDLEFAHRRFTAFYSPSALRSLRTASYLEALTPDAVKRSETEPRRRYEAATTLRRAVALVSREAPALELYAMKFASPGFIEQLGNVAAIRLILDFWTGLRKLGYRRQELLETTKIALAREGTQRQAARRVERIGALALAIELAGMLEGAQKERAARRLITRAEEILAESPDRVGEEFILYSVGEPLERLALLADDPRVTSVSESEPPKSASKSSDTSAPE
jgi:hypothetical protein